MCASKGVKKPNWDYETITKIDSEATDSYQGKVVKLIYYLLYECS